MNIGGPLDLESMSLPCLIRMIKVTFQESFIGSVLDCMYYTVYYTVLGPELVAVNN